MIDTEKTPSEIVTLAAQRLDASTENTSPAPWAVADDAWPIGDTRHRYVRTESDQRWEAVALTGDIRSANPVSDQDAAYIALMHPPVAAALADWLRVIADDMSDEDAVEREFPGHIPAARWLVVDWAGKQPVGWTEALALARTILRLPNPNQPAVARG